MNRRIRGEPRLADYIYAALEPHIDSIRGWKKEHLAALFFGFGNLKVITPSGFEFLQSFFSNANDICLALDELGFENLDYVARDFWNEINSGVVSLASEGEPRSEEGEIYMRTDLFKAFENISCILTPVHEGWKFVLIEGFSPSLGGEK